MGADFECDIVLTKLGLRELQSLICDMENGLSLSPLVRDFVLCYGEDPIVPDRVFTADDRGQIFENSLEPLPKTVIFNYYLKLPPIDHKTRLSVTAEKDHSIVQIAFDEAYIFGKPKKRVPGDITALDKLFAVLREACLKLSVRGTRMGTEGGPIEELSPFEKAELTLPERLFAAASVDNAIKRYWD